MPRGEDETISQTLLSNVWKESERWKEKFNNPVDMPSFKETVPERSGVWSPFLWLKLLWWLENFITSKLQGWMRFRTETLRALEVVNRLLQCFTLQAHVIK